MKKFAYTILLGASALIAACTALPQEEQVTLQDNPDEVAFSAYLNRSTTKAGAVGELKTDGLQTAGFGVFGYHTDNALYSQAALPNFMYNTKVSGAAWEYSPIKYWPNEYGENASSEAIDRLTFFAYAPWVSVNSATGALTSGDTNTGITRLTRATDTGDPMVSYKVSFDPSAGVDLCYGVAKDDFGADRSSGTTEGVNNVGQGSPYINVARPNAGDKIAFTFLHALTALNVQIDAKADGTALDPDQTKIYVRSVTFEGFSNEGSLNLNSNIYWDGGPQWVNYYCNGALSTEPVTVYDGRRDGREGSSADANEKPSDLNPVIVQSVAYGAGATDGVTSVPVNLFNSTTLDAPVYVIPNGDLLKVTIAYDVETRDPKIMGTYLADGIEHGSVVENTITKTIPVWGSDPMWPGDKYVIKLHLGLNSVDFEASVEDWAIGDDGAAELPANSGLAVTFSQGGTPVTSPLTMWVGGAPVARTASVDPPYSATFGYESSNTDVATVASDGTVTAKGPGMAIITASATATKADNYYAVGSYTVYVNELTAITSVETSKAMISVGEEAVITATVKINDGVKIYGSPEIPLNFSLDAEGDSYLTLGEPTLNSATKITIPVTGKAYGGDPRTITVADIANTTPLPSITIQQNCAPVGTTGYVFSVSDTKRVYFATGNLVATINGPDPSDEKILLAREWKLAENQYYSQGYSMNYSTYAGAKWDKFSWVGSSAEKESYGLCRIVYNDPDYSIYLGQKSIEDGETLKTNWGSLSGIKTSDGEDTLEGSWTIWDVEEATYLINSRSEEKWGYGVVNGIQGLIIIPDNVTISLSAYHDYNNWSANTIDLSSWNSTYESVGCVFLPYTGLIIPPSYCNGLSNPRWGRYHARGGNLAAANQSPEFLFGGCLGSSHVPTTSYGTREWGQAVRLIREF